MRLDKEKLFSTARKDREQAIESVGNDKKRKKEKKRENTPEKVCI